MVKKTTLTHAWISRMILSMKSVAAFKSATPFDFCKFFMPFSIMTEYELKKAKSNWTITSFMGCSLFSNYFFINNIRWLKNSSLAYKASTPVSSPKISLTDLPLGSYPLHTK